MHYLVGVSHFARYGTNLPLIVYEKCQQNSNKPLFRNGAAGEEKKKVIQKLHRDPDRH